MDNLIDIGIEVGMEPDTKDIEGFLFDMNEAGDRDLFRDVLAAMDLDTEAVAA